MIQKNDVVIVIRPELDDEGNYVGNYKLMHTICGPITLDPADMEEIASVGLIMSLLMLYIEERSYAAEDFEEYVEKHHLEKFQDLAIAIQSGESTVNLSGVVH